MSKPDSSIKSENLNNNIRIKLLKWQIKATVVISSRFACWSTPQHYICVFFVCQSNRLGVSSIRRAVLLLWIIFVVCVLRHTFMSIPCDLVVACWGWGMGTGWPLFALVCDVFLCFRHFPIRFSGSGIV